MDWLGYLGAFFVGAIGSILAWIFIGRPIVRDMTWKGIEKAAYNIQNDKNSKEAQILRSVIVAGANFVLTDEELKASVKNYLNGEASRFSKWAADRFIKFLQNEMNKVGLGGGDSLGTGGGFNLDGLAGKFIDKFL